MYTQEAGLCTQDAGMCTQEENPSPTKTSVCGKHFINVMTSIPNSLLTLSGQLGETKSQPKACPLIAILAPIA